VSDNAPTNELHAAMRDAETACQHAAAEAIFERDRRFAAKVSPEGQRVNALLMALDMVKRALEAR